MCLENLILEMHEYNNLVGVLKIHDYNNLVGGTEVSFWFIY